MRFTLPLSLSALVCRSPCSRCRSSAPRVRPRSGIRRQAAPVPSCASLASTTTAAHLDVRARRALKRTPTPRSYRRSRRPAVPAVVDRHLDAPGLPRPDGRRSLLDPPQARGARCPRPPAPRAALRRVSYSRRLTLSLRRIYPGHVTRRLRAPGPRPTARRCGSGSGAAPLLPLRSPGTQPAPVHGELAARLVHVHPSLRGRLDANTGNGYYGGLQMDRASSASTGRNSSQRWGTADNWPVWAQLQAAVRAYSVGPRLHPWPNTARACGLL